MKLFRTAAGPVVLHKEQHYAVSSDWDALLARSDLRQHLESQLTHRIGTPDQVLAPIVNQEVWAAGVTYLRSREARMEESKSAGADNFYDRVYSADRPELFFKSAGFRVIGPGGAVRLRADSRWSVPEPELTLLLSAAGQITGYTIGNDMSCRDIEGENPLYLPQAKIWDGACALGPCIFLPDQPLSADTAIHLAIRRAGDIVFQGGTSISRIKRPFASLADYLFRHTSFPHGCFLMTGTGVVPPDDFTLRSADEISITIPPIGTLQNNVEVSSGSQHSR